MSNFTKSEFVALDISGNNYLSWILDAEIHLDAFTNPNKVLKSHIPAVNAPAHIEIPIGDSGNAIASTFKPRLKRGRPIRSKDSFPRKRKSNKLLTPVKYNFDEIAPE